MNDLSPTLRAGGHAGSHANAGVMPAVCFPINPNALRGDTHAKTPSKDAAGVMRLHDPGLGVGEAGDPADTLQAAGPGAVAYAENQRNEIRELSVAGALSSIRRGDAKNETLLATSAVRRLTPRECERLQGFPDDYTLIPWRKGLAADGPRYKALGNSMAVPVMSWIGRRIAAVEASAANDDRKAA
jgi:DNA (cytosine-5)-methyltransferase 1